MDKYNIEDHHPSTLQELIAKCQKLGIDYSGTREILIERLCEYEITVREIKYYDACRGFMGNDQESLVLRQKLTDQHNLCKLLLQSQIMKARGVTIANTAISKSEELDKVVLSRQIEQLKTRLEGYPAVCTEFGSTSGSNKMSEMDFDRAKERLEKQDGNMSNRYEDFEGFPDESEFTDGSDEGDAKHDNAEVPNIANLSITEAGRNIYTIKRYFRLSTNSLRYKCQMRGLPSGGKAFDLFLRLVIHDHTIRRIQFSEDWNGVTERGSKRREAYKKLMRQYKEVELRVKEDIVSAENAAGIPMLEEDRATKMKTLNAFSSKILDYLSTAQRNMMYLDIGDWEYEESGGSEDVVMRD